MYFAFCYFNETFHLWCEGNGITIIEHVGMPSFYKVFVIISAYTWLFIIDIYTLYLIYIYIYIVIQAISRINRNILQIYSISVTMNWEIEILYTCDIGFGSKFATYLAITQYNSKILKCLMYFVIDFRINYGLKSRY